MTGKSKISVLHKCGFPEITARRYFKVSIDGNFNKTHQHIIVHQFYYHIERNKNQLMLYYKIMNSDDYPINDVAISI